MKNLSKHKDLFAQKLLKWWESNKEEFPWRKSTDPYKVLIAEILLRKTTSQQVLKVYEVFLEKYPNVITLAQASLADLKGILRPLGMEHKRSDLLLKLACTIKNTYGGIIPYSLNELLKLPGVGRYVASGVLCLAHKEDVPMVDTNAIRVIQRVFGFRSTRARAKDDPELWAFAEELIPEGKAKDFNLAIIDFAHQVCLPKKPRCKTCIMNSFCANARKGKRHEN